MGDDFSTDASQLLSPQQKELLRLVHSGITSSKLLSRETGLQPSSVKSYLYRAARILGTDSRTEAAQRFAALERRTADVAPSVPTPAPAVPTPAPAVPDQDNGGSAGGSTPEPVADPPKSALYRLAIAVRQFFTGLPVGGRRHTLSWPAVGLQILRTAIIGMIGLTAVVLFVFGFLKAFSYPSH